jgi:Subtilase family
MDCAAIRHGTTVAGVAAAGYVPRAPMIGVAPEALLGAYKVRIQGLRPWHIYACLGVSLLASLELLSHSPFFHALTDMSSLHLLPAI